MENLSNRLKNLIESKTNEGRRYKQLEELTEISSNTWKGFLTKGTGASANMIEKIGELWPEYMFWVVTGIDDSAYGHQALDRCGYPQEAAKKHASVTYLKKELNKSKDADKFILEHFTQEELTGVNAVESQVKYDQNKRLIRTDEFFHPERTKKYLLSAFDKLEQKRSERMRFLEVVIANIHLLKNSTLELELVEHVICEIRENQMTDNAKYDVLEKTLKVKQALEVDSMMKKTIKKSLAKN
jgi:hypothetical protein